MTYFEKDETNKETLPRIEFRKEDLPIIDFKEAKGENWDSYCFQVSLAMALKKLDRDYRPNLEELKKITLKDEKEGTWPAWGLGWLKKQGFRVELLSGFNWKKLAQEGKDYFRSEEVNKRHKGLINSIEHRNLDKGAKSARYMIEEEIPIKLVEGDPIDILKEIFERIKEGESAIFLLDGDHYIVLVGFNGEKVYYLSPSEKGVELKEKDINRFIEKWTKFNLTTTILIGKNKEK